MHRFIAAADPRTRHRRGIVIIESDRNADIGFGRRDAVGRIEADPAIALDMRLGPGVRRRLHGLPVGAPEMPRDVARGVAEHARGSDEDMRVILADAVSLREGDPGVAIGIAVAGVEADVAVDPAAQRMEARQWIGGALGNIVREAANRLVGLGLRGLAQEEFDRQRLGRADDHAGLVLGQHLAADGQRDPVDRAVDVEHANLIAIAVAAAADARVAIDLDMPVDHRLPIEARRCHPQQLDEPARRARENILRTMLDEEPHQANRNCWPIA